MWVKVLSSFQHSSSGNFSRETISALAKAANDLFTDLWSQLQKLCSFRGETRGAAETLALGI